MSAFLWVFVVLSAIDCLSRCIRLGGEYRLRIVPPCEQRRRDVGALVFGLALAAWAAVLLFGGAL